MTNADAHAIAKQIRREVSYAVSEYSISEVHFFAAIPQALAVLLGHSFNAMPPVQIYEYENNKYRSSIKLI